jgi:predicted transcriptional regulator
MRRILISIKPKYASLIFSGEKKYEYRKRLPKDVNIAVVYVTSPVKKVVGEFKINGIMEGTLVNLWERTQKYSGLIKEDFLKYYNNRKDACALVIGDVKSYEENKCLTDFGIKRAPQSWQYIK